MTYIRQLVVPAKHDQLTQLAAFVAHGAEEAGFEEGLVNRIELAVDEACSNIIDHAYDGTSGLIQLEVTVEPHQLLKIVLVDQGQPFDPQVVPEFQPCLSLDDVRVGGLGLHLMRQAMDDVCFEFNVPGLGNRLTMVKHI
jgi:serine/threonine-protein kinase RsbW